MYKGTQDLAHGQASRAVHASVTRGIVERVVLVYRVSLGKRFEFLPRASCASPDYYHQQANEEGDGSGACWHVRAVNLGLADDPHWVNLVLAHYADTHDLYLPAAMLGVRFIRYHEGELLQVDYLWNPDLLLTPPAGRVWVPEDWSNAAVQAAPDKRAIMEVIRGWSEDWQPKVDAALPF